MLFLLDEGWNFEAVFVDHGTDWPETYEYLESFQTYLKNNGCKPIKVLKPARNIKTPFVATFDNLYDFCWAKRMFPSRARRWCTTDFKVNVSNKYFEKPCFNMIGFASCESHRAKISSRSGEELRYPLIENQINRAKCKEIITNHGLSVPPKSGCFVCPFMRPSEIIQMRYNRPDLFCKLEQLETRNNEYRKTKGLKAYYSWKIPVNKIVNENQYKLFEIDNYPPCNCML